MATKSKTWAQLEKELAESFRKWHAVTQHRVDNDLTTRSRAKRNQKPDERAVRLWFVWWRGATRREITLVMKREPTATENLAALAATIETLRMAEYRDLEALLAPIYRQMFPEPQQSTPPPAAFERQRPRDPRALPATPR